MYTTEPSSSLDERSPLISDKSPSCRVTTVTEYESDNDSSEDTNSTRDAKGSLQNVPTAANEAAVLVRSSFPLIFAYLLQYSLTLVTISVAGHLGTLDVAAASLAIMTSNVTGIGIYEGFAAGLDTLCAQAYGAGQMDMIGVHVQRMIHLMFLITIPITALWLSSSHWLCFIVHDANLVAKTAHIMALLVLGNPGYLLFESGRRFVQAQGLFDAPMYVMLAALPTNIFLTWLFVSSFQWGISGAILALSMTRTMFPIYLIAYVLLVKPSSLSCWGGLETFAPRAWARMIKLAIPGVAIVLSEVANVQFLIVSATYLSITESAAQSVLTTVVVVLLHVPLAMGIAVATRVGQLVGCEAVHAAKFAMKTFILMSVLVGIVDAAIVMALREPIITLFTRDLEVATAVRKGLPFLAVFMIPAHSAGVINGMLRGIGKQGRGAWFCFGLFGLVGVPASLGFAFGSLHLGVPGLWMGSTIAYFVISMISGVYGLTSNLEKVVQKVRESQ